MSFDVYLASFRMGEAARVPRQRFEEVFRKHIVLQDKNAVHVEYDEESSVIFIEAGPDWHGLSVNRPRGYGLWASLFELALLTRAVIYWPGEAPCMALVDAATIIDLPKEMVEALGPPILMKSGSDLRSAIVG